MRISNGNFLDEDGNEVNLVKLLRTGKATPVVNNNDGHHMSAHSGWFTDENGTPVNIVALIDAAIDEDGGDDEPPIGGISINVVPTDTASGAIATFNDGADDIPVKNLTVNIEPIQSGTGDPSPDNVRPISGWTGATLTCNNETINIDWTDEAGTVYGGTLDVTNGKLTVDMAMVDLGTLNWYYFTRTNPPHFGADVSGIESLTNNLLCSNYATEKNKPYINAYGTIRATSEHSINGIKISDTAYTDTNSFTAAMSGVQLVYELANPITYQLTPQEVKTILGANNIYANTGDVSVEYRADIKKYIDKVVATAVSALS